MSWGYCDFVYDGLMLNRLGDEGYSRWRVKFSFGFVFWVILNIAVRVDFGYGSVVVFDLGLLRS